MVEKLEVEPDTGWQHIQLPRAFMLASAQPLMIGRVLQVDS